MLIFLGPKSHQGERTPANRGFRGLLCPKDMDTVVDKNQKRTKEGSAGISRSLGIFYGGEAIGAAVVRFL